MLNAVIIVVALLLAGYLAFSMRLATSSNWQATAMLMVIAYCGPSLTERFVDASGPFAGRSKPARDQKSVEMEVSKGSGTNLNKGDNV